MVEEGTIENTKPISNRILPALSENKILRYCNFIALYAAQGIPEGMTFFGIPAWMAMNGKSPAEVGSFVAVIGLPWSFKVLIAPLMDRFTFLPMGRRRPWVLAGQLGLMISFIAMALLHDPLNNLNMLMAAGFMVSFFGAFQDVATDGMAVDIVPINQQATANGFMWGSKVVGSAVSLVIGTWVINEHGFKYSLLLLSVMVCCIMFFPLLLRERPGEKLLPWTSGSSNIDNKKYQLESWSKIFKSLFKVFILPTSIYLAIATFVISAGIGLMDTLLPVFTIQEAGWTNEQYAQAFATINIISGVLGMIAGGFFADKFGKVRVMSVYLGLLIILVTGFAFLSELWNVPSVVTGFMSLYYGLYVFLQISIFGTAMALCWKRISATQFTLYMALANLGRAAGAGLLGPLTANFTWTYVIVAYSVFAIVTMIIIQFLRTNKHLDRVDQLESVHIENELAIKSGTSI